jgi:hypothetical protein
LQKIKSSQLKPKIKRRIIKSFTYIWTMDFCRLL